MNVGERASAQEVPADVLNRWRKLLSEEERPTPNAEPDRFLATVSALGSRPVIMEIEDGHGRPGMIIARREPMRVSTRIGYFRVPTPKLDSLVVVYGGILGRISSESVIDFLTKRLLGTERCDHIMINSLVADSPVMLPLRRLKNAVVHPPILHHRLRLGDTFESIMSRHSGKHRRRLSWERRNLESVFDGKLEWVTLTSEEEVDRGLRDAARIGRRTYHAKVGWLVEENDLWRAQLTLAAQAGELRAHFLVGSAQPIAFVLGWNVHNSYHVVAMAYLPEYARYSPGKHLLLHAIERACVDGMEWVDYGFGDAEYKRVYGTDSWQESTVHIYGRSLRAGAAHVLDITAIRVEQWLRTIAGSSAAARIKKKWRQHVGGP